MFPLKVTQLIAQSTYERFGLERQGEPPKNLTKLDLDCQKTERAHFLIHISKSTSLFSKKKQRHANTKFT